MQVGLHQFSPDSVAWMRKAVDSGEHSRTSLAHELCEVEDWRNSAGELCLALARKVLPRLADSLGLVLPASRPNNDHSLHAYIALSGGLQELGDVRVEPVAPGCGCARICTGFMWILIKIFEDPPRRACQTSAEGVSSGSITTQYGRHDHCPTIFPSTPQPGLFSNA